MPAVPDEDVLKRLSLDELQELDHELSRAALCMKEGIRINPERRVLDELENRPALTNVYDEQAADIYGRRVYIRHERNELISALARVNAELARQLEGIPELPLYVARALVFVKQYDDRWGDSDYPHALIGEDVSDSLDAIARFSAEHQEHVRREAHRARRLAQAEEVCRRVRTHVPRRNPAARVASPRSQRRHRARHANGVARVNEDPEPPATMAISELTRRELAEVLASDWHGRLDPVQFLSRLYDLSQLPSKDPRFGNMAEDITAHTIWSEDWESDWVFEDQRLELSDDETLVRFAAETLHPIVLATQADAQARVARINEILRPDGWELHPVSAMSGRPIYAARLVTATFQQELERVADASTVLSPMSGAIELAIVAFKNAGKWHVGGVRLSLCAKASDQIRFRSASVLIERHVADVSEWKDIFANVAAVPNLEALLEVSGISPLTPSPWNTPLGWREEQARSLSTRVPILRSRRGHGPLTTDRQLHRRFLAALEETDYFDTNSVRSALGIELPQSVDDHVLSAIELELPIRVSECRLGITAGTRVLRSVLYASPTIEFEKLRASLKLNTETAARPLTLTRGTSTDNEGWSQLLAEIPVVGEETGATIRLTYETLSVLLSERPILKDVPDPPPDTSRARTRVVVVEQVTRRMPLGPPSLPVRTEDSDENTGFQIGNWQVGLKIGSGSYGRVYKTQQNLTGQQAVVKLIDTSERGAAERFRREASCLGLLQHPRIPRVLDAGVIKNEQLAYILQEELIGADLDSLLSSGWRPSEAEVLELLQQMSEPLTIAHDNGVVHRDLKPANLFLEELVGGRTLRVLDFGCAKLIGASKLTSAGVTVGTLAYQPPEAFDSSAESEASADIWSIGATAYELLTGVQPFIADDHLKTLARIAKADYQRLDHAQFPMIGRIIEECLQVDASLRPQNAEALGTLITRTLDRLHDGLEIGTSSAAAWNRGPIALWLNVYMTNVRDLRATEVPGELLKRFIGHAAFLQACREFLAIPATVGNDELAVWMSTVVSKAKAKDGFTALRALLEAAVEVPRT